MAIAAAEKSDEVIGRGRLAGNCLIGFVRAARRRSDADCPRYCRLAFIGRVSACRAFGEAMRTPLPVDDDPFRSVCHMQIESGTARWDGRQAWHWLKALRRRWVACRGMSRPDCPCGAGGEEQGESRLSTAGRWDPMPRFSHVWSCVRPRLKTRDARRTKRISLNRFADPWFVASPAPLCAIASPPSTRD